MVPRIGFSQKTRRMWAAWMCLAGSRDCPPVWLSDSEVYGAWLESVSGRDGNKVLYGGDEPPF
jgi:hypothetical protein